ncbi:L,D-transpeptidase family protein [Anaerobiospirillum sp. NML120449]|uniref:L,D-transpeptidase family protein n=1 Tax=Anaerobiospirillum sp. NML120449 TaxID=2932817 RepID=UPI001FF45E09|nr:L,D-transpeptidase family protein [Anaerobiospirillum sp. NML120449]MCK0527173.1 L,D-transpeptidase family protein [Anaerobiospirillum sp. NML120449]
MFSCSSSWSDRAFGKMALSCAALVLTAGAFSASMNAHAAAYPYDEKTVVVGEDTTYQIARSGTTTLEFVASRYQLGLSNLIEANPGVDPIVPVNGTNLIIPQRVILPDTLHQGIIVNSPEMRLYYYHNDQVEVLPIGIGQLGTDTPLNWTTRVERKRANPTWTPTAKMHAEYAARGETLPKVWPAGPDNPMGLFAIYIGRLYAIHGTNADFGIGLRVSHGCVRLRNEDIEYLYNNVPVGTRVQFINEPIKTAEDAEGNLYIEVHQPLSMNEEEFETLDKNLPFTFTKEQEEFFKRPEINQEILQQALSERSGRVVLLNPATF